MPAAWLGFAAGVAHRLGFAAGWSAASGLAAAAGVAHRLGFAAGWSAASGLAAVPAARLGTADYSADAGSSPNQQNYHPYHLSNQCQEYSL